MIGRETEIFRLLPKYDSIPTTSSPGVTFHILNSWYNEDPKQSKWILTERKHPLGPYIKPNISPAPVPVHPKKLQRIKNLIDLIGATCTWQYTITISSEESESAIKELGKCVCSRWTDFYKLKNIYICIYMHIYMQRYINIFNINFDWLQDYFIDRFCKSRISFIILRMDNSPQKHMYRA